MMHMILDGSFDCECKLGAISVAYLSRDENIDYWICIFDEIAGHIEYIVEGV